MSSSLPQWYELDTRQVKAVSTGNLKSEDVYGNCPVHTTTPDATQARQFCHVWCELSRPDCQTVFDGILEGAFCVGSALGAVVLHHGDAGQAGS